MFTKQQIQAMHEEDLRNKVLVPLLWAMKYEGVHEYHGTNEFGKDIICWKLDELNNRECLALVVKAVQISGQSKASADIENQVRQCFSKPYVDKTTGLSEEIDRCWVVSNKRMAPSAVDLIKSGIGRAVYSKNVRFVDIDALWKLIEEYMPFQTTLQKLEEVRHDYETWDTHYRLQAQIDANGIHHTIVEKFPGAAQEKPLEIRSIFEFPDTEDGRRHKEALERFFETGAPTQIPAAYIKSLEYSEVLQRVYPTMTEKGFLQFGSIPHPKPFLMRCEIVCDDGDQFLLEHVHFLCTQVGRKEATFTNATQPIAVKIQLAIHFDGTVSRFHINLEHDVSWNVHQVLRKMQLGRCLSKPHTIRFINLETGFMVGSGRSEVGMCEAPDEDTLEAVAALDALQQKSGQLIVLPERELTGEEHQDLNLLRSLYRTGSVDTTWKTCTMSILVTDEDRDELTQTLSQTEEHGMVYLQQEFEKLSLFGEEYDLGTIKPLSLPAKLTNWLEVKALLDQGFCGSLQLEFAPRDNGSFTKEYLEWLPEKDGDPASKLG
ncbi:hypothetical protein [Ktedonospora formicarum]|nr:hypothetical protein [Ktedonospora formicarum]